MSQQNSRPKESQTAYRKRVVFKTESHETSVNRSTRRVTVRRAGIDSWGTLTHPDLILLPSFERGYYITQPGEPKTTDGKIRRYLSLKRPSVLMNELGCDRCSGPHTKKNEMCSANLKIRSPFLSKPNGFYDIKTGERLHPQPVVIEETVNKRGTVRKVLLQFSR